MVRTKGVQYPPGFLVLESPSEISEPEDNFVGEVHSNI